MSHGLTADQYPHDVPQIIVDWLLEDYESRACEITLTCDSNYVYEDATQLAATWSVTLSDCDSVGPVDCHMDWSYTGVGPSLSEACGNALALANPIEERA